MYAKEVATDEPELSEGEKDIEEYFLDENIKYESQKKIYLEGDDKSYRVVDFYLPKYDLYVEFLGRWNDSKEERDRATGNRYPNVRNPKNISGFLQVIILLQFCSTEFRPPLAI